MKMKPSYIKAYEQGVIRENARLLAHALQDCTLCPRNCHADRLSGDLGTCSTGELAMVSSYTPHFGEESPISGTRGSGTIFFTHCNLLCNFCQNFDISHQGRGQAVTARQLANMMLRLQEIGCHNINFVSPTHVVAQILQALILAIEDGLKIPLVYNTGGYDHVSTLELLDGIIDIYMPDFKFWDGKISQISCGASDYPERVRKAISEMYRQVGDLRINNSGLAEKGLLVRHLVLPERKAGTAGIMKFLSEEISSGTYVNIMSQYRPCGPAAGIAGLDRPISPEEFREAFAMAIDEGIIPPGN